jgi:integrase
MRNAETVSELCDLYLAEAEAGRVMTRFRAPKKASTLAIDRGRVVRHIKPLLGHTKVAAVTSADIERLLHDVATGKTASKVKTRPRGLARVKGGRGAANRVVRLLGGIFTFAVKNRMRSDNPVHGVEQFKDGQTQKRLSASEYRSLGGALGAAREVSVLPAAVDALHLLALTGWRPGEILGLRWEDVDLVRQTAFLADTKTGRSMRPLSCLACDLLKGLSRREDLVFPATRGDNNVVMSGFKRQFRKIANLGQLGEEVTPNVLRHSFASVAADMGYSDLTIAALIGHKGRSMTSRYIHGADPTLLAAADAVSIMVCGLMQIGSFELPIKNDLEAT